MAFKKVADLSADITISLGGSNRKTGKKNPVSVEGYYLGKREVADNKKESGTSYLYFFQTPTGNVAVWGKTDLDRKMGGVTPGTMVRASFDRMVNTANGEMYKYTVEIDEDNSIDVSALGGGNVADNEDDGDEDTIVTGGYEDGDNAHEALSAGAIPSTKAAQASALLKGRGNAKLVKN